VQARQGVFLLGPVQERLECENVKRNPFEKSTRSKSSLYRIKYFKSKLLEVYMSNYPKEVELFLKTLLKLKGISSIESGIDNLEPIVLEMLGQPDFSHLPHASLLRTNGGLKNEVLIQFEFLIDNSIESLHSLEFISWFVRDSARGGTKIQLRPFALPPETPYGRQFGTSLRFHIDLFIDSIEESLEPALKVVQHLNESIDLFIKLYNIPLKG
jgi:hypothetical protein